MQEAGVSTDGNAEVWWSGGCSARRKLESAQMGMQKCGGQEGVVHAGSGVSTDGNAEVWW